MSILLGLRQATVIGTLDSMRYESRAESAFRALQWMEVGNVGVAECQDSRSELKDNRGHFRTDVSALEDLIDL